MSYEQDWEPVVWTKKKPHVHTNSEGQRIQNAPGHSTFKKLDGDDVEKLPATPLEIRQQIVQGRQKKGMTQKQLAQMVNMPVTDIVRIEGGKDVYNKATVRKLLNALK